MKRSTFTLRRLLALVLVLVTVGSLFAGCGKKAADPTFPSEPFATDEQTVAPTTEATEAPTEEPTEAPTEPVETVPPVLMGTVNADNLNVRSEPYSTADILKRLAINTRVEILEQKIVDGVNWGRIAEGWINLNYVTIGVEFPGSDVDNTTDNTVVNNQSNIGSGSVTTNDTTEGVTTTGLNIRKDSNANSDAVGSYAKGTKVTILERSNGWGRTNKGWINLKYVDFSGKTPATSTGSSSGSGTNSATVSNGNTALLGYGTVVKTTSLAIRSGPGANYSQISYIVKGERHAYYQTSTNGWVRMKKGWVNADYLELEYYVESGTEATVTASELSVREEADYNSEKLHTYKKGDEIVILETKGTWGMVEYASGQYGWVDLDKVKLPAPVVSDYSTGIATVTADALHIREKASVNSESLGTYKKGDKVEILEVKGNWGRTEDGWINLKYTTMEKTYTTGSGTVTASTLNIRKEPSEDSSKVGTLKNGDKVTILDTEGTWGKIEYKEGKFGWISLKYVKITNSDGSGSGSSTVSGKYKIKIADCDYGVIKANGSTCNQGTKVTLTATPATGFVLESVSVVDANGTAVAVTNNTSFTMPAADVTVTATFVAGTVDVYSITDDTSGNGSLEFHPGTTDISEGTKVIITADPDDGYTMSSITVTNDETGKTVSVTNNTFTMPAADVTVKATFAELDADTKFYTVTIDSAIPTGAVLADTLSAVKGTKITLTVTAPEGQTVKSVTVKDENSKSVTVSGSGATRTFNMPESDVTVYASFEAKQYKITTTKVGSGSVSTTTNKCAAGTDVTVTATPAEGYILTKLEVYGANRLMVASDTNSPVTFEMPAYDVTVKATFELIPYTITVTDDGNGTAEADKASAAKGTKITITAEPAEGYKLDKIYVDGKAISGKTFTMPAADVEVYVTFKKVVYTVNAKSATGGKIKVSPTTAEMGDLVTVTITPNSGYELTEVSFMMGDDTVPGVENKGDGDYTFTMPAGNVTISAKFTKSST